MGRLLRRRRSSGEAGFLATCGLWGSEALGRGVMSGRERYRDRRQRGMGGMWVRKGL